MIADFPLFSKDIDEISADDLKVLRQISEGWYVEYKRSAIKAQAIAKSLTSFANQYGGYLFFGVEESSTGDLTAGGFPGIPERDVPLLCSHIRDSSATFSSSTVPFQHKVIRGPSDSIGLPAEHAIIVVEVPAGVLSPYVHSSGRIYRHVGDSSQPRPENDRFQLDELWKRQDKETNRIQRFIARTDPTRRGQGIQSWMHLYLFPDPNRASAGRPLTTEAMAKVFKDIPASQIGIPMHAIYSSALGITARQVGCDDPTVLGLSVHCSFQGFVSCCLPINVHSCSDLLDRRHASIRAFIQFLTDRGYQSARIADFSKLSLGMVAFFCQILQLKDLLEDDRDMLAGYKLSGLLRTSPFVDAATYLARIERFGVPVLDSLETDFPEFEPTVSTLIRLRYTELSGCDMVDDVFRRAVTFGQALIAIALSSAGIMSVTDEVDPELFIEMYTKARQADEASS